MSYNRNFYPDQRYKNYPGPSLKNDSVLKSSAEEFTPGFSVKIEPVTVNTVKETTILKPPAVEFVPGVLGKGLNAGASDFRPLARANLNSDAAVFEIEKAVPRDLTPSFKAEKINEFVPETLPDEKFDEPIFIIPNRELTLEDLSKELKDIKISVDISNSYLIEEIQSIYKLIRTDPNFERVSENVKEFGNRVINTINSKKNKKNKESFKANQDWRELESADIIATTVWRKPKTEEEEKISNKAKIYKMKLTGTVEEQEKIKRSIKSTMNKVLPTNLNKLREQLLETGKQSTNNLIVLVQCIFEKAWSEVKYTEMYANLCKFLKEKLEGYCFPELEHDSNYGKRNLFKYELLERCQNVFTQAPSEDYSGLSPEDIDSRKEIIKKKTLGNVRFIGELFKVGLITTKVILGCVDSLICKENLDENKLEGACILLSTGGSSFERSKVLKETESIFKTLDDIMKKESLSSKIKFKIMDLIDERNNQWKKSFKEEVKTIQEIHQEFEQEMKKKRML
jgi:hypothetical protein